MIDIIKPEFNEGPPQSGNLQSDVYPKLNQNQAPPETRRIPEQENQPPVTGPDSSASQRQPDHSEDPNKKPQREPNAGETWEGPY